MRALANARSPLPALAWVAVAALYGFLFLGAESERALGTLVLAAAVAIVSGGRWGVVDRGRESIAGNERIFDIAAVAAVLAAATAAISKMRSLPAMLTLTRSTNPQRPPEESKSTRL